MALDVYTDVLCACCCILCGFVCLLDILLTLLCTEVVHAMFDYYNSMQRAVYLLIEEFGFALQFGDAERVYLKYQYDYDVCLHSYNSLHNWYLTTNHSLRTNSRKSGKSQNQANNLSKSPEFILFHGFTAGLLPESVPILWNRVLYRLFSRWISPRNDPLLNDAI